MLLHLFRESDFDEGCHLEKLCFACSRYYNYIMIANYALTQALLFLLYLLLLFWLTFFPPCLIIFTHAWLFDRVFPLGGFNTSIFFRTSRNSLHGDLIECDFCPLSFHTNCLQPPLTNKPLGMWMCPNHAEHAEVTKIPKRGVDGEWSPSPNILAKALIITTTTEEIF